MNFLEIAQRLYVECGLHGLGVTSLSGQSGTAGKVVGWMSAAYNDIQALHTTWQFLRKEFSFPCTVEVDVYGSSQHLLTDVSTWDIDTFRCYLADSDEQYLDYYYWEQFRDTWKFGANRTRSGRPISFSVKPDLSVVLDCLPDAAYTIAGEYYRAPAEVSGDTNAPIFPAQYHMAIVWRGLMFFAADSGEPDRFVHGDNEYSRLIAKMELTQLPTFEEGPPLA